MNYQQIYNDLCAGKGVNRDLNGETHDHHIFPRCMGGNDDPENLVILNLREHFIAHRLLTKIYPNYHHKLRHVVFRMSACYRYGKINSRIYERLREQYSESHSEFMLEKWKDEKFREKQLTTKNTTEYKVKRSQTSLELWQNEEYKIKTSTAMKEAAQKPEVKAQKSKIMKGHWQDDEKRAKQSEISKERWQDEEYRAKQLETNNKPEVKAQRSASMKEKWQDEEFQIKHSASLKTPEVKAKQSAAHKGTMWINNGIDRRMIPKDNKIPEGWSKGMETFS